MSQFKSTIKLATMVACTYVLVMLAISAVLIDNPEFVIVDHAFADYTNPFEEYTNITNHSEQFAMFEGYIILASATETSSHNLHLFALPGQSAQIYRDFSIFIFSNQPCTYEIKIDEQVYERGYSEWKTKVKGNSPYSTIDISVTLVNESNVTLPVFNFKGVVLLDSPWDAISDDDDKPSSVPEEWIKFSRGEFTTYIIRSIVLQISCAFLGIVTGVQYAVIHADLRGIRQVM
ncbi:MAG: hypothetical protein U9M89_00570 [Patescibacteria group bacterium]|nr:hypothetical protein [Patescibacteria group bacterium]